VTRGAWASIALIIALVLCGAGLGVVLLPAQRQFASVGASDASNLSFRPHPGARLPLARSLIDESGRTVVLGDYFASSPVILVLEYLRCRSLCGVTLRNLVVDALGGLPLVPGRDYQLVAISIDPRDNAADAAAARAKYVALLGRSGGETGLHFLTASAPAVREIADAVGFPYRYDKLVDAYIHPAGFVIAAPDGIISRYVEGVAISPQQLVGALADAEQDKSQGLLTRILLLCHVQGAPLGRLTVPVLAALMMADAAAGFTLIAVFVAIRRRRHG
jgi:protein SCO1/2